MENKQTIYKGVEITKQGKHYTIDIFGNIIEFDTLKECKQFISQHSSN